MTPPGTVVPAAVAAYADGLSGCCLFQLRLDRHRRFSVPHATEALLPLCGVPPGRLGANLLPLRRRLVRGEGQRLLRSLLASARDLSHWTEEFRLHADEGERWVLGDAAPHREADGATLWCGYLVDVSRRREAEQRAHRLAFYDLLTGLPNRRLLLERLAAAATDCGQRREHGAVLFVDLDDFKLLNDTRGHDVGDLLLAEVARRLSGCLRERDTVARLGGDEFVVVLERLATDAAEAAARALHCAGRLHQAVDRPALLQGQAFQTRASIGVALFDGPELQPGEVMRRADIAMYAAKGGGGTRLFDPQMQQALDRRLALTQGLRRALAGRELELHVQPQRDAAGTLLGAEALLRWHHPEGLTLAPGEFLPLAERTGLAGELSRWVLREGCRIAASWQTSPALRPLRLSVNVPPSQFCTAGFVAEVRALLDEVALPPGAMMLELTEEVMRECDAAERMAELKRAGLGFALDDFGTGFSSLARLRDLPFDEIKVDASFVRDLEGSSTSRTMVRTIIGMARTLGLVAVAEGVETPSQRAILLEEGCAVLQGFLLGQPMSPDAFALLAEEEAARLPQAVG